MHVQLLLILPAREAAAQRALALLGQAERAQRRCRRGADDEALHDFRVALRRLRSHCRAYRETLPLPEKLDKALRRMARRTNPARETEVALAWTRAQGAHVSPKQRPGVTWLIARLSEQTQAAHDTVRADLLADWPPLATRLRHRLHHRLHLGRRHPCVPLVGKQAPSDNAYGPISAALVRHHAEDLRTWLSQVHTLSDHDAAHRARIRAKRLRYLLEPWTAVDDRARTLVARLRRLQDTLGHVHDGELMSTRLGAEIEIAALAQARRLFALASASPDEAAIREAKRRDPQPGLLALTEHLRAQQAERFARLKAEQLGSAIGTLVDEARDVADIMATWPMRGMPRSASTPTSRRRGIPTP